MPRLRPFLKGRGHRLEFVVGVMKVTNGRKGAVSRRSNIGTCSDGPRDALTPRLRAPPFGWFLDCNLELKFGLPYKNLNPAEYMFAVVLKQKQCIGN